MTSFIRLQSKYESRISSFCNGLFLLLVFLNVEAFSLESSYSDYPPGKLGEVIQLGEAIVEKTIEHPLSKPYVGNKLNCTSCHLKNGKHPKAGTFMGSATAYPAWAPREERVITLEDRVLNCFMRSCNGKRPPLGSEVSIAVTTYITWLSKEQPFNQNALRPIGPGAVPKLTVTSRAGDKKRGEYLYNTRCADCHGRDGSGDTENPPVWGPDSYNDGAGLSDTDHLAAWLKVAMPMDDETLSEQEAVDIAVYVNSQSRPHFELQKHLPAYQDLGRYNGSLDTTPARKIP